MKKIVIITGVAGMIGSCLLEKYIKKKYTIIGIDNFTLGKKKFIKNFFKKNFFFLNIDLSKEKIAKKIKKIVKNNILSEIWLMAANSDINLGRKNKDVDLDNTFLTTYNTLNNLSELVNTKTKIIFASSSAIYGEIKNKITEDTLSLGARSNYGAMKLASESYVSYFSHTHNVFSFIFRFPNVVGKNLTHGVIYDLYKKLRTHSKYLDILGNGHQQKPYSYDSEIIDCMIYVKEKKFKKKINTFNIGTDDKGIKVKEIVKILLKKFKSNKIPRYEKNPRGWLGDIPKYRYSTYKINSLGFKFKLNSRESVKLAIDNLS
jgi:UDP-glucose 4-epimerase